VRHSDDPVDEVERARALMQIPLVLRRNVVIATSSAWIVPHERRPSPERVGLADRWDVSQDNGKGHASVGGPGRNRWRATRLVGSHSSRLVTRLRGRFVRHAP